MSAIKKLLAIAVLLLAPALAVAQTPPNQLNPNITVTTANVFMQPSTTIAASSLFSYTDTTGTATAIRFWNASAGNFIINGSYVAAGTTLQIVPSQLSLVVYRSGGGTDQIQIEVGDANGWSDFGNPNGWAPFDALVSSSGGYFLVNNCPTSVACSNIQPSGSGNILVMNSAPGVPCQGSNPEPVDDQYFTNTYSFDIKLTNITFSIDDGAPQGTEDGQYDNGWLLIRAGSSVHQILFDYGPVIRSNTNAPEPFKKAWSPPIVVHPGDTLWQRGNCYAATPFGFTIRTTAEFDH